VLRDSVEVVLSSQLHDHAPVFGGVRELLVAETGEGKDYGAFVLVEAESKWALLLVQQRHARDDEAKGRPPRAALAEVRKLRDGADLDLPEVKSDLERELGRLLLACGEREGARGAWERARDLAPDPRRREAAEEALKKLAP
jgi:hypothetical protein